MAIKRSGLMLWLAVALVVLSACGGGGAAPTGTGSTGADQTKVILVLNGLLGDKSYADSAQRGMDQMRQELGVATETVELGYDSTRWQSGLEDVAANSDYDILIVGTVSMVEYLMDVAPRYPDKLFILFDATVEYDKCANKCTNVYSVMYKQNEGSYLAGLYAGLMAQENDSERVGVLGGIDIPVINDFVVGYRQGATDAGLNAEDGVLVQYAGGFNDPAKGKEIAKAMYSQGAGVIFNVAGGTGLGIFEAAAEEQRMAIGVDSDQWLVLKDQKPELANTIATSMLKNVDNSLVRAMMMHQNGTLPWGKSETLGIAEGGVGLARNEQFVKVTPAAIVERLAQAEKDVTEGKITVESTLQ